MLTVSLARDEDAAAQLYRDRAVQGGHWPPSRCVCVARASAGARAKCSSRDRCYCYRRRRRRRVPVTDRPAFIFITAAAAVAAAAAAAAERLRRRPADEAHIVPASGFNPILLHVSLSRRSNSFTTRRVAVTFPDTSWAFPRDSLDAEICWSAELRRKRQFRVDRRRGMSIPFTVLWASEG